MVILISNTAGAVFFVQDNMGAETFSPQSVAQDHFMGGPAAASAIPTQPDLLNYRIAPLSDNPDVLAHYRRVRQVNRWLHAEVANPHQMAAFLSGDRKAYPSHFASEVDRLKAENEEFAQSVLTPEARGARAEIFARYDAADIATIGQSNEVRAAARLASSFPSSENAGGVHMVIDYDNTLTDESQINKVNGVKPGHPAGVNADEVLGQYAPQKGFGNAYTELFPVSFQPVAKEFPEVFFENGRTAPVREGAEEFLGYLKEREMPLRIASANVDYAIWGTLSRFEHPDDTAVWSITQSSTKATQKGAVIVTEALANSAGNIVYVGDGGSDSPALEAQDVVAFYVALEGGTFAKDLEAAGALYFTYNSLTDISDKLKEIESLSQEMGQSAGHASLPHSSAPVAVEDIARI